MSPEFCSIWGPELFFWTCQMVWQILKRITWWDRPENGFYKPSLRYSWCQRPDDVSNTFEQSLEKNLSDSINRYAKNSSSRQSILSMSANQRKSRAKSSLKHSVFSSRLLLIKIPKLTFYSIKCIIRGIYLSDADRLAPHSDLTLEQ